MPTYTPVQIDYPVYEGGNQVFVPQRSGFPAQFGKLTPAFGRDRQAHFENVLRLLEAELGTSDIPVFVLWADKRLRMDRGCVGHAIASGFLLTPPEDAAGIVSHVRIRNAQD